MTHLIAPRASARRKRINPWLAVSALLFGCAVFSAAAHPQTVGTPVFLGQIIGDQVSVIGPSHAVANGPERAIEFSSGDTIVVFAGKAHIEFAGGREVDICGPAKFTLLSSGQALTIALNFGRVHVRFDALRPITVYTALVVATPVSLGDRPRDATVGFSNAGTMCVLAAQGAVRLQNQLSGETVIVPEPSEVLVPATSFTALPAAAGQCRCDFDEPVSPPTTQPPISAFPPPAQSDQAVPLPEIPKASPQTPPTRASQSPAPASGESAQPILKATLPPIGYDAKSATETAEPLSEATLMLAQQAVVQPAWIFHGTVVGSGSKRNATSSPSPKKPGLWARLRHFFAGSR